MIKGLRRNDLLLAAALLVAAGLMALVPRNSGNLVVVTVEQQEYAVLPLQEDARLVIDSGQGAQNVLVIQNGSACVESANCENQLCVRSTAISREGEMIVCLPHKVVITVEKAN